jgi:hypothetical protein
MRFRVFTTRLLAISLIVASVFHTSTIQPARAGGADFDTYSGNVTQDNSYQFLKFNKPSGSDVETLHILDQQERDYESGAQNEAHDQTQIDGNTARAQRMVDILKGDQMNGALNKVTKKGDSLLKDNPDLQSPGAVIASAVALWYGRGVKLFKTSDTTNFYGRFEGRTRTGEFSMQSPLFNGRLRYVMGSGADVTVNRSISSVTSAEVVYRLQDRTTTAQMRQRIFPNIDVTFGAAPVPYTNQMDGRAGLYYNLSF